MDTAGEIEGAWVDLRARISELPEADKCSAALSSRGNVLVQPPVLGLVRGARVIEAVEAEPAILLRVELCLKLSARLWRSRAVHSHR